MTDRELMQQALYALEHSKTNAPFDVEGVVYWEGVKIHEDAITALRDRLAYCDRCGKKLGGEGHIHTCSPRQPEQEPFAYSYLGIKANGEQHGPHLTWKPEYMDAMSASMGAVAVPLYTAPPQRKPLTDEQIDAEWRELDGEASALFKRVIRKFARAIEAKLKEKNNG